MSSPCSPPWPPFLTGHHHLLWTLEDEQRGNSRTPGRRGSFWQSCLLLELLKERDLPKPPHLYPDPWECWWKSPLWQSISKLRWCVRWLPFPFQIPSTLLHPLRTLQTVLDGLLCLLPSSCLATTRRQEVGRREIGVSISLKALLAGSLRAGWLHPRTTSHCSCQDALFTEFSHEVPITTPSFCSFWPVASLYSDWPL